MHRLLRATVVALACLSPVRAAAQETTLASSGRGPRFLVASESAAPVPVDIARTPVLNRRITLQLDGVTLDAGLKRLAAEAGFKLSYSNAVVPVDRPVHLKASDITVVAALTELLLDTGVDVLFSTGTQAVLVRRSADARAIPPMMGVLVGRVTDAATGAPVAGADVALEATALRTTAGSDGRYRLAAVPPGAYTLRVRYIGYAPATAAVTVTDGQETTANLVLERSVQQLDQVVTTGTIVETERKALPNPITVITAEEIRARNAQRLDALFQGDIPGVFSSNGSAADEVTRIFVRGGSNLSGIGEVKTYVNGVEVGKASFLSVIDPNMIERIELIRGPQASTIYGSQALAGVLQIFTKQGSRASAPQVEGRVEAGVIQTKWVPGRDAVPTYNTTLNVAGGGEGFSYTLGATRRYRDEFVERFRAGEQSIFGTVRGQHRWLTAELTGRIHTQNRRVPLQPTDVPYVDLLRRAQQLDGNYQNTAVGLTLHAQFAPFWRQTLTIGADRFLQEFETAIPYTPTDPQIVYNSASLLQSIMYTNSVQGALGRFLTGSFTAGVNLVAGKGTSFSGTGPRTFGALSVASVTRDNAKNRGYFAQGQLGVADQLFLTAGLRAEDNPYYGEDYGFAWSPRAGIAFVHTVGSVTIKPRASYGKSIRPPSSSARLGSESPTLVILPNPKIGPEAQRGFDTGVELYFGDRASFQATYYDQRVDGLIDAVVIDPGPPEVRRRENIGRIKNRGIELEGSVELVRGLALRGNYSIASSKVERLSPSYTGDFQLGDRLIGIPKYSGGGSVQYSAGNWTTQLGMRYAGTWTHYRLSAYYQCAYKAEGCRGTRLRLRDYWETYEGFAKLRMHVTRRVNARLSLHLDVENLTNDYTFEETDASAPVGRSTTLGLSFRL